MDTDERTSPADEYHWQYDAQTYTDIPREQRGHPSSPRGGEGSTI